MYHLSYTVQRSVGDDIKRNIGILLQSIFLVVPVGGTGGGGGAMLKGAGCVTNVADEL